MSIIHDALKRVQQGLTPKTDETQTNQTETLQEPASLYTTPQAIETLTQTPRQTSVIKSSIQNKIKSILAFICAITITAGAGWYIYQQFRNDIPRVQRLAKRSFYKLIHKKEVPDFKTKNPEDLKPLAQLTFNPATGTPSNTAQSAAPITLNIHGIMSNPSGNLALINDQVYQEGDEVDGAKIVKINLDSITVDINGTEKTVFVNN